MHQISADCHTKQDDSKEEFLVLKDNLDDMVQKQYQDMCQEGDNTFCWNYHPEYTDDLDPPEAGAGNQIRFWFGFYLDQQLWDYGNVELQYLGVLTASQ